MEIKHATVVRRIGDEEYQALRAEIANLELRLPLDSLHVVESGFRFDNDDGSRDLDCGIGRAEIAGDGHGNLRPPGDGGSETPSEAFQQGQVRPISYRIAVRLEGRGELKPHNDRDPGREVDGEGVCVTAFGALQPVWTDACGPRSLADAESSGQACPRKLFSGPLAKVAAAPRTQGRWTFAAAHARRMQSGAWPALYLTLCRSWPTHRRSGGRGALRLG